MIQRLFKQFLNQILSNLFKVVTKHLCLFGASFEIYVIFPRVLKDSKTSRDPKSQSYHGEGAHMCIYVKAGYTPGQSRPWSTGD